MSTGKHILIIGCGIAGPVLGMLLKQKGFDPVIYERQPEWQPGGVALGTSPQTFKVLNILGLAEKIIALGQPLEEQVNYSQLQGKELGRDEGPGRFRAALGWPVITIARSKYSHFIYTSAVERGITVHFSKKLVDVKQEGETVTAIFADGTTAAGDLLVGADGLHSAVRNALFGKDEVTYMGIMQVGGYSPIPDAFKSWKPSLYQAFGDSAHFLSSPMSSTEMAWSASLPQLAEAHEDWRRLNIEETRELVKGMVVSDWENGPKEMVNSATWVTKYGLYERPVLPLWHKGRVVLVGDASHPTSPHLGQGANQAMEDCYHLTRLLVKATPFTDAGLEAAFKEYESIRVPLVTKAVATARQQGESRVVSGKEACEKRDAMMQAAGGFDPERQRVQKELMMGPFTGESEI